MFIEKGDAIMDTMDTTAAPTVIGPADGRRGWLGGLGIRFMVPGANTGGQFAMVEHPLKPHALAAPMHRHTHEDEFSYVLRGRVGASLGGHIVVGGAGDLIYKPRGQWHTFWNASDDEACLLEIIAPAGFESYFAELLDLGAVGKPPPEQIAPIAQRYALELDATTIPQLCAEHGLSFG